MIFYLIVGIFVSALLVSKSPTPAYATHHANCQNLLNPDNYSIDSCNNTCPTGGTSFLKSGNVTYYWDVGNPDCMSGNCDCTREQPLTQDCSAIDTSTRNCPRMTCQAVTGDNLTVDCASPSRCLIQGYDSTRVCSGGDGTTWGGGCVAVYCSWKQCTAAGTCLDKNTESIADVNYNAAPYNNCQTTSSTTAGYCAVPTVTPTPAGGGGGTATPIPTATPPALPAGACSASTPCSSAYQYCAY